MENLCRICRNLCFRNSVSIASDYDGVSIKEILIKTFPVDLTSDDPISLLLPQIICNECLEVVSAAYNLQFICLENDKYFRSMISNSGDQIVVKTEILDDDLNVKEEVLEYPDEMNFGSNMIADNYIFEEQEPEYLTFLVPVSPNTSSVPRKVKNSKPKSQKKYIDVPTLFCDFCGASGDISKQEMEIHMMSDHLSNKKDPDGHKTFDCTICGAKFFKKYGLDIHTLSIHDDLNESQKITTKKRVRRSNPYEKMYRILDEHEIEVSLKCCFCEEICETEDQLVEHFHSHKDLFESSKVRCILCTRALETFEKFLDHASFHAQPKTHECLTCKKRYPYGDRFKLHLRAHQKFINRKSQKTPQKINRSNEKLICPECGRPYATSCGLNRHVQKTHQGKSNEGQFKCKSCPRTFEIPSMLKMHEVIHSKERLHVCDICGNSFKLRSGLTMHKARLHDQNAKVSFECHLCDTKFSLKTGLKQHMLKHTGEKPHKCKLCEQAYRSKGDLTKHMERLHFPGGIYQCEKCLKRFRLLVDLREHQLEHADQ